MPSARARLQNIAERRPAAERPVLVSAITGEGIDTLADAIEARLAAGRELIELELDPADGAGVSWLHRHTEVHQQGHGRQRPYRHDGARHPDKAKAVRTKFANGRVANSK